MEPSFLFVNSLGKIFQKYSCNIADILHICCKKTRRESENFMGNISGVTAIIAVCLIVLAIGAMGQKMEWLINFVLRAVMGTVGIYVFNYLLAARQVQVAVGINPLTVLTSGILGFPGVAVLYGIHFFKIL